MVTRTKEATAEMGGRCETGAKKDAQRESRHSSKVCREALILQHLPLVRQTLGRIAARLPQHVSREDLLEAGTVGLVDAARRFDPGRNVRFSTYAITRIRGAILDALREEDWLPRSLRGEVHRVERVRATLEHENSGPVGTEAISRLLKMPPEKVNKLTRMASAHGFRSLEDMPAAILDRDNTSLREPHRSYTQPTDHAILEEHKEHLARAIEALPERERLVISLYYFEHLNLREIAETLGVTNSRVCQIHRGALRRLHRLMRAVDAEMMLAAG